MSSPLPVKGVVTMDQKDKPFISMSREEREKFWDDAFVKEEGIILELNLESHTGKVRSLH
jgi:hypothetical protein